MYDSRWITHCGIAVGNQWVGLSVGCLQDKQTSKILE